MSSTDTSRVTQALHAIEQGDRDAVESLVSLLYNELRQMAAAYLNREPAAHTLQPTALVHEVFLKLVDQSQVNWKGRTHFLAVSAQAMRRILVDHARRRGRTKRGGDRKRVILDDEAMLSPREVDDILAVDEALERLAKVDERQAKVVELRFFGGLTVQETADALGVSKRTIENEWKFARAWLRREFSEASDT